MGSGRIQNEDIKTLAELQAAGGSKNQLPAASKIYTNQFGVNSTVEEILSNRLIHGQPLLIHQGSPADSKIYFEPSSISTVEGSALVAPPIKSQILNTVASWIDFQAQTTSGVSFIIVWPASTVGYFRYVGFTLLSSGVIQVLFTPEAATVGALVNPGTVFATGGMPLGYILLQATDVAGKFKTKDSVTNVIENTVSGSSRVFLFGSGGGVGGGSGDTTDLEERLKTSLVNSIYEFMTPDILAKTSTDLIDEGASTGSFDLTDSTYQIDASEIFQTKQLVDPDFLNENRDIPQIDLHVFWLLANIDNNATYAVSRDGGVNFQNVTTMIRVGETDEYQGTHIFATEPNSNLDNYPVANADSSEIFNATSSQKIAIPFTTTVAKVFKEIEVYISKTGSPAGSFVLQLVKDVAGQPSTVVTDVLVQSAPISISALSAGNNVITKAIGDTVLKAGNYHVVIVPDAAYQSSYSAGVNEIALRTDTSAPTGGNINNFNGTIWSAVSGESGCFYLRGRVIDIRVKVTSSAATRKLTGLGIKYAIVGEILSSNVEQESQSFSGDENKYSFTVTNFLPNSNFLKVYQKGTGKVFIKGDFYVNGQNITFPINTFNLPGETIELIFDQSSGGSHDSSETNSNNIAAINSRLGYLGTQLDQLKIIDLSSKISVPYTTIVNRAKIPDLTSDLSMNLGINRLMTHTVFHIQDEFGPNGEPVFGVINDYLGLVRLVGGLWITANDAFGVKPYAPSSALTDHYMEITFYGTGLNLLWNFNVSRDWKMSVDGGAEVSNVHVATGSSIYNNSKYGANQIHNFVSGLALGIHTVKIRANITDIGLYGFEILNESTSLKVNKGAYLTSSNKYELLTQQSIAYNSGFEFGTLGTKGGRVLTYLKSNNTVAKAITPTDGVAAYLTSADHANEEVSRTYTPIEFGSGRSDDWSLAGSMLARAFTLDDGTTTFSSNSSQVNSMPGATPTAVGAYFSPGSYKYFIFVGTGLDIELIFGSTDNGTYTAYLNGTSLGAISYTVPSSGVSRKKYKIASGLPYGTHVFKIVNSGNAPSTIVLSKFITYQPKTPVLPANAVELGNYNIVADYASGIVSGNIDAISTGVIHKQSSREMIFVGSWTMTYASMVVMGSQYAQSATIGNYFEYTFWGTGCNILAVGNSASTTVSINGVNYTGAATAVGTGSSWTPGTSTWATASVNGAGLIITGLALGKYTVRVTLNNAVSLFVHAVHIITPVHSPESNYYGDIQNSLPVGSNSVQDGRKTNLLPSSSRAYSKSIGVTVSPTTTSTTMVPIIDMSASIRITTGKKLKISYSVSAYGSVSGYSYYQPFVNGIATIEKKTGWCSTAGNGGTVSDSFILPVSPGFYKVDVYASVSVSGGTLTFDQTFRNLTLEEVD